VDTAFIPIIIIALVLATQFFIASRCDWRCGDRPGGGQRGLARRGPSRRRAHGNSRGARSGSSADVMPYSVASRVRVCRENPVCFAMWYSDWWRSM
jgi:hypothetical protein